MAVERDGSQLERRKEICLHTSISASVVFVESEPKSRIWVKASLLESLYGAERSSPNVMIRRALAAVVTGQAYSAVDSDAMLGQTPTQEMVARGRQLDLTFTAVQHSCPFFLRSNGTLSSQPILNVPYGDTSSSPLLQHPSTAY